MKTRIYARTLAVVAAAFIGLVLGGIASAEEPTLDGQTITIALTDPSGETGEDSLVFVSGTFESVGCREYGFGPAAYTATAEGEGIAFDAVATSEAEGTMTWHGVITDGTATGTAIWTKEGQDAMTYSF